MNIPFSIFRFLAIIAFLGTFFSGIFITNVKAQKLKNSVKTAHISEIEIKGTSDLESSQIMFLIESQVGEPLNRKKIRRDIHAIFEMNLFEDVTVEVELQDEDESGFKGYLLRFLVSERPRLAEIKFEGILLLERTEIEDKMTLVQYDPYDPEKINLNKQIILEYNRSEGYPRVKVNSRIETIDSEVKSEGKKFRVIFEIEEKPRFYLSDIYIS